MTDLKSEALSNAKKAIRNLQQQMSDRLFKMAGEVERLLEHLSPKEVVTFLHAGCEMDIADAGTFLKVNKALKDSSELLREARIQFPVLKALATADDETRTEVVSRIAGGATMGARDVAAIRANLRNQKKTFAEQLVASSFRSSTGSARRRALDATRAVDKAAFSFPLSDAILLARIARSAALTKTRLDTTGTVARCRP